MAKRKSSSIQSSGDEERNGAPNPFHPRFGAALFGHHAAVETFLRAFRSGALHHAWLLTGEEGVGKATFAYLAARLLLSNGHDKAIEGGAGLATGAGHPIGRQIAAGAHPSLFVLDGSAGGAASIGVEAVRKLRAFLSLTSPGGWRAMIVDPANDLTASSANALLKAIEEPPPQTVFFLVSQGAAAVMPTIRSRCVKLAFRPLHLADFQRAVSAACISGDLAQPSEEELSKLHAASSGSPGRALDLLAGGLLPLSDKLDRIFDSLPRIDYALAHSLIQSASGARNAETFARLCDLVEARVEATARCSASDSVAGAQAWADLWRTLRERRLEMEALNLDKGAFLLTAFSDMEHAARKSSLASPA